MLTFFCKTYNYKDTLCRNVYKNILIWTWNKNCFYYENWMQHVKFVKKTSMPKPVQALDISSARAQVAPKLLKALAILTDTTIRRSAFDREDRKPNSKSEKRPHFSRRSASLLFTRFFKDFPNYRKKTNRVIVFCQTPFPNILKYRNYWWDLQTIWRTRFLQKNIEEFT